MQKRRVIPVNMTPYEPSSGVWQAKDSRDISDEEGTEDGKPRDKKRKEVRFSCPAYPKNHGCRNLLSRW